MSIFQKIEQQLGGRPKKVRKIRVNTYLTKDEEEMLREMSKQRDLSISHLIRSAIVLHLFEDTA